MLKFSGFHFKKPVLLSVAILGLAMIAIDASAQTENGKIEEINPKNTDRIILEDHTVIQDNSSSTFIPTKTSLQSKSVLGSVKKESIQGEIVSEKEVKKSETASTLSFNIFLYIVDKFKAD